LKFNQKDLNLVSRILEDVRKNKDTAVVKYVNSFDSKKVDLSSLKVSPQEFKTALKAIKPSFLKSLNLAADQIETFHQNQLPKSWVNTNRKGTFLGQLVHPLDAAGIYIPGGREGKTPLVSSILMCAIPAKIAGVKKISITSPPRKDGTLDPHLLVAAKKVGVDTVYKAGSAWGIGALAYGTETISPVDIIAGPGNIYVTLAKKILAGVVGIDMIAGPSEILIIADETAKPEFAAADLLSQAEHDTLASAILVTTSKKLALDTAAVVEKELNKLKRREIAIKSIKDFGAIMIVPDLETAVELANKIAPEHLELLIESPFSYVGQISNAGAIFMGHFTPEPVGDYIAGPNHVLPTAGTARFSSALSVEHFVKKTSLIHYTKEAFYKEAQDIIKLAEIEGLEAHLKAVKVRLKKIKLKK